MKLEDFSNDLKRLGYEVCFGKIGDSLGTAKDNASTPVQFGLGSGNYAYITFRGRVLSVLDGQGGEFFFGECPESASFPGKGICLLAPSVDAGGVRLLEDAVGIVGSVIIKNVAEEFLNDPRICNRVRKRNVDEWWHSQVPEDDQGFPEISLLCGKGRSGQRSALLVDALTNRDIDVFRSQFYEIYEKWVIQWNTRNVGKSSPFFYGFFESLFNLAFDQKACGLVLGVWRDGMLVGFLIGDYRTRVQIDIWGGCVDYAHANLGKVMQTTRNWAACRDVQFLNLGGSETESLHQFKLSLGDTIGAKRHIGVFE